MKFEFKLAVDKTYTDIVDGFGKYKVQSGWFEEKNTVHKGGATSSLLACIHVNGSPARNLSQRDFVVGPIQRKKEETVDAFQRAVDNTQISKNMMYPVLKYLGNFIVDSGLTFLQNQGEGYLAPLSQQTKDRKGHDRIMEEKEFLKKDWSYRVVKND